MVPRGPVHKSDEMHIDRVELRGDTLSGPCCWPPRTPVGDPPYVSLVGRGLVRVDIPRP